MNKFLKDLEKELKKLNVSTKETEEILADHKEMMEAAKQEGLTEDEMSEKFGNPTKVASEISQDSKEGKTKVNLEGIESIAKYDTDKFSLVNTFQLVSDLKEFSVKLVNDDFILADHDEDYIQVFEEKIKDIEEYEISVTNNKFLLKRKSKKIHNSVFNSSKKSGTFLVLMPKSVALEEFDYHTVNGEVNANQLVTKKFALKSTNGDLQFSNVKLGEAKFSLVNGDIKVQGFKASSLDVSLVNGDVKFQKGIVDGDLYFNSVSGDTTLIDVEGNAAAFKTVSGDLDGKNFYIKEISLKSVSGDVNISNDDKTREIKVKNKKTLSGDININK